jgi:hypothetical protein
MNCGQIFRIATVIDCAMLSEIPSFEQAPATIQLVSHCRSVNFHACRVDNQIVPLTNNAQEEIDMRSQMHKKADRLTINCYP